MRQNVEGAQPGYRKCNGWVITDPDLAIGQGSCMGMKRLVSRESAGGFTSRRSASSMQTSSMVDARVTGVARVHSPATGYIVRDIDPVADAAQPDGRLFVVRSR